MLIAATVRPQIRPEGRRGAWKVEVRQATLTDHTSAMLHAGGVVGSVAALEIA